MHILIALLGLPFAVAEYQEFFFTANGTCPGLAWPCRSDSVISPCAYDSITDKHYCCGGAIEATCRVSSPDCLGENGGPSSTQQLCTAGDASWCCLKDTEECTPRQGQVNVCIGTQPDVIGNVSQEMLNEAFSSLSSAHPMATTFSLDTTSLAEAAMPTALSTATPIQSSATSASSPTSTSTSRPSGSSSNSLSGGTIAGIVVGCLAGLCAVLVVGFLLFRRQRYSKCEAHDHDNVPGHPAEKMESHRWKASFSELPPSAAPAEMGGSYEPRELPDKPRVNELPG